MSIDPSWEIINNQANPPAINPYQKPHLAQRVFIILMVFMLSLLFSFIFINFPALYQNIKFAISRSLLPYYQTIENQINLTAQANQNLLAKDEHLIIPKINLDTSIQWDISSENLASALKKGLVHLSSSSKPDQTNSQTVLIGYSSLPWWQDQGGGTIFSLIHKLAEGDRLNVNYQNNYYVYQVKNKTVLANDQLITDLQLSDQDTLLLVSYYPLGINTKQLVVTSRLISTSDKNKKSVIADSPNEPIDTTNYYLLPKP